MRKTIFILMLLLLSRIESTAEGTGYNYSYLADGTKVR